MKKPVGNAVILFDHSVGELREDERKIVGVNLFPAAERTIEHLNAKGHAVTVVILRNMGGVELEAIRTDIPAATVIVAPSLGSLRRKDGLGLQGKRAVFVAADRASREIAADIFEVEIVPHLGAAEWILEGERLSFARIVRSKRPDSRPGGVLPYYIESRSDGWLILGLATDSALLRMIREGAVIDTLPFDYRVSDCGLLRVDSPRDFNDARWQGSRILAAEANRLLLAFQGSATGVAPATFSGHGSLEMLFPSPELLSPVEDPDGYTRRASGLALGLNERFPQMLAVEAAAIAPTQRFLALPDSATFRNDAERYSGLAPLDMAGSIVSRHIKHPDNLRVVNALVKELLELGYCSYTHSFVHNGQTLNNVVADMPGRGYFRIDPAILKKLLAILRKYRRPWPWEKLEKELVRELGKEVVDLLRQGAGGSLRRNLEAVLGVHRSLPWQKLPEHLFGIGAQIVIVGSHLDSSAERRTGSYNPAVDSAPGMDDNASGMAACLAAARYLVAFKGQLVHTVRFCFFNAEEAGLVGSKSYASSMKALNAPIKAVICADMLGYNSDANFIFEIHAGYTDPAVRDLSLPIGSAVEKWAASLGSLQPPQIYKGTSSGAGAPDRSQWDPAINRSDHGAFHQQGYPAVAVTEDYFSNLPTEIGNDPNPNYHTPSDNAIDADYGVAIASAVACAAKELAGG